MKLFHHAILYSYSDLVEPLPLLKTSMISNAPNQLLNVMVTGNPINCNPHTNNKGAARNAATTIEPRITPNTTAPVLSKDPLVIFFNDCAMNFFIGFLFLDFPSLSARTAGPN